MITNDAHLNVKCTCAPKMSQYEKGGQCSNEPQTLHVEKLFPLCDQRMLYFKHVQMSEREQQLGVF